MKSFWTIAGSVFVLLASLYAGCYLAMVQRHVGSGLSIDAGAQHCWEFTYPGYRVGGKGMELFFRPALWIDQRIRTRYWAETTESDPGPKHSASYEVP